MDDSAASEVLTAAAGGAAPELARRLMLQASGADMPDDPLSAMLAVQAAAVHEAALRALRRAGESTDKPEAEALYARLGARLLHLFQRQAKTLAQRRETARLEARAAEYARREAEELRRRRELEERRWDPDDEEDDFEEDDFKEDDLRDDDDAAWAAEAADRDPAAHGAAAQEAAGRNDAAGGGHGEGSNGTERPTQNKAGSGAHGL